MGDKLHKLLDCPFCGEIATLTRDERTSPPLWKVVCTFCGASVGGEMFPYSSPGAAVEAWNTRGGVTTEQEDI